MNLLQLELRLRFPCRLTVCRLATSLRPVWAGAMVAEGKQRDREGMCPKGQAAQAAQRITALLADVQPAITL